MNRNLSPLAKPALSFRPQSARSLLQRKCACGTRTPGGGTCARCGDNDAILRRREIPGVVSAIPTISRAAGPMLQRQEGVPETKSNEDKLKEGAGKAGEGLLETEVGKEIIEGLEKAFVPDTAGKLVVGTMAVGAIGALAANHEALPMALPVPFIPGLSVKLEGPIDSPTGIMFSLKSGSDAPKRRPAAQPGPAGGYRPTVQGPAAPYRAPGIDIDTIIAKYRGLGASDAGGLQLTVPIWSWKRRRGPSPGDELKLAVPGGTSGDGAARVQPKLAVGSSDDPLEHQADRIAEQILAGPAPAGIARTPVAIQRASPPASTDAAEAPQSVDRVLAGSGIALDDASRKDMERRFGHDFSAVRVHHDNAAARSARDVGAEAYTVGRHIVFGAGRFSPQSADGRRLLAHELTHVVQQSAAAAPSPPRADRQSLQRKVIVNGTEMGAKERADFLKAQKWTNAARAQAILDDMASAADIFDFDDQAELQREIGKRISTVTDLLKSQETVGAAGATMSAFGYPFSNDAILYGPRVNWSARDYWVPKVVDDYKVRTDKAKNKQLINSARHMRCQVYGDQCGLYSWHLSDIGKADPYHAMSYLFTPQPAHKRTLIHCDYLISVVNFMSFAKSIGEVEFNKRIAAFGPEKIILYWNAFTDLDLTIWQRDPSGNLPADPAKRVVQWGLGSGQALQPSSEADLVIGDHVVFSNHSAYPLINEGVGNAWRLENAVLIRRNKGVDVFLGHGSGERTGGQMNAKLVEEYNQVADEAAALTARADSKVSAVQTAALARLPVRFPNVRKVGNEWKVQGKDYCANPVDFKVRRIAVKEVPGLKDPCNPAKLGWVRRPIESAKKRTP